MAADAMKLPVHAAFGAVHRFAEAQLHKLVKARIVIGKLHHEFGGGRACAHILRYPRYGYRGYGRQFIIPLYYLDRPATYGMISQL